MTHTQQQKKSKNKKSKKEQENDEEKEEEIILRKQLSWKPVKRDEGGQSGRCINDIQGNQTTKKKLIIIFNGKNKKNVEINSES